jgi:hypothetical protein
MLTWNNKFIYIVHLVGYFHSHKTISEHLCCNLVKDIAEDKGVGLGHASGPLYFPCFSFPSFFFVLLYFKAEYGVLMSHFI